jgi:hypothetical protein
MSMPANFGHAEIFRRGRPRHGKPGVLSTYDAFYIRHPPMSPLRRAKLFAPFDALRGFSDAVSSKREVYEARRERSEEDLASLDRRLQLLQENLPLVISVTFYEPCADSQSEAFGSLGKYPVLTGLCTRVDVQAGRCLYVDGRRLCFSDIYSLESPDGLLDRADPDD